MLKTGDLIFIKGNSLQSKFVRWILKSEWNRIAFYLDDKFIIESDLTKGINIRKLDDYEDYEVKRYDSITDSEIEVIRDFMVKKINNKCKVNTKDNYSCAKLIDNAFHEAKLDLFPNFEEEVTTSDIYKSIMLNEIAIR